MRRKSASETDFWVYQVGNKIYATSDQDWKRNMYRSINDNQGVSQDWDWVFLSETQCGVKFYKSYLWYFK